MGVGTSSCCVAKTDAFDHVDAMEVCDNDLSPMQEDTVSSTDVGTATKSEDAPTSLNDGDIPSALSPSTLDVLSHVRALVDDFQILKARALLIRLQQEICSKYGDEGAAEWATIMSMRLIQQVLQDLKLFEHVGWICFNSQDDWFSVYKNLGEQQSIEGCFDTANPKVFQYRIKLVIPSRLSQTFAVVNELELHPLWQPNLVGLPQIVGRRVACRHVVHGQMSFVGGMYKIDNLFEVKRFVHTEGGLLVEHIQSIDEDHPDYIKPKPGYNRTNIELRNVWIACGSESTCLIQVGKVIPPFPINKRIVSSMGPLVGRPFVKELARNSLLSTQPNSPWAQCLADDKYGLYAMLRECEQSRDSVQRQHALGNKNDEHTQTALHSGLNDYFQLSEF